MITGTADMAAICRKTASPCESASSMSSRISEGDADMTSAIPSLPLDAVTTSNPSTESVAAREPHDGASSSMIRMVGCPSGGSTPFSTSRKARVTTGRWLAGKVCRSVPHGRVGWRRWPYDCGIAPPSDTREGRMP